MKFYSPLRDALWLASVALFILNNWWIKPNFAGWFWHSSLNDILCLPVWMPVCVWILTQFKLRHRQPPRPLEIAVCLLFWSVVFEIVLPRTEVFGHFSAGDPFDVLAYAIGGVIGWIWWKTVFSHKEHEEHTKGHKDNEENIK